LIKTLRTVKLGEDKSKYPKNTGISITEEKRLREKSKSGRLIREAVKTD
jgi:hypothetical protein